MRSPVAERPASSSRLSGPPTAADGRLYGHQRPRIAHIPAASLSSSGQEAVELAAVAGLELDDWQQYVLDQGMAESPGGKWATFEVATVVPRQNGKGSIIEARELAGLFLLGERLILHSAHELKTAMEGMRRIEELIAGDSEMKAQVLRVRRKGGEECIELKTGQRLRFIARSQGSGRGMTGDCNIMDEAMILGHEAIDALLFTMAAVPNPQIWYFGSSGIGRQSVKLAQLRNRALLGLEAGELDPSLTYCEWSIDAHRDECPLDCTDHDDPEAVESVLKANPGIGYRLTLEHTENERRGTSPDGFARERLGVGTYPVDSSNTWRVIPEEAWRALTDHDTQMDDDRRVAFAVDTTPERSHSAIGSAGYAAGDNGSKPLTCVDVVDHRHGTGWVVPRLVELVVEHDPCAIVIDPGGPAASLIPALRKALAEDEDGPMLSEDEIDDLVVEPKSRQIAAAAAQFYDATTVEQQTLRHLDPPPLATALAGVDKRPVGSDGWTWSRRTPGVDISPLVAATHAAWGLAERADAEPKGTTELWI
ncbi:terminase [Streptomyces sp. NPDC059544]|uniref:terminase n=1 Tax=Streptomyces sp. NPDC059544 TaxID=3346861 RepID=UPI0036A30E63